VLEDLLNSEGLKAVEKDRQSFIDGEKGAKGKKKKAGNYEVKKEGNQSFTLTVYGRKDISDLEDGVSPDEYASNPASFSDLEQWISARGLNRTAESIDEGLRRNGWVSGNGPKGGTPNIITTPTNQILKSIQDKVSSISKELVAKQIVITV